MEKYIAIKNNQSIPFSSIPEMEYGDFLDFNTSTLQTSNSFHCVNYYGVPFKNSIKLICCMANDDEHSIWISSCRVSVSTELPSFTAKHFAFEKYEREIHENFGIAYSDHPWLKPVRYSFDRFDKNQIIANYPFFRLKSDEIHEVGVGPIHAGVIEPGHFRFTCNGEQVPHLEIQLGFQHRGVEHLMQQKKKLLQRTTLAESIAGDTAAGHTTAFVNLWESLCHFNAPKDLQFTRTIALELERIAMHTADLSALCADVAYQLGSAVYGRLRTPVINYFQIWCGNRLAKSLIRAGKNHFPFNSELESKLLSLLDDYERDFDEMTEKLFDLPSALIRFEKTGVVANEDVANIGTVGMAARMSGVMRDVRKSHPHDLYREIHHHPIIKSSGDVFARVKIRAEEIPQSISYLRTMLQIVPEENAANISVENPGKDLFCLSLVEGWRGEICHCAITNEDGELYHYKIKDPSFHNWLALALALRNNEISDFPLNNKSFNLSYCGHDL